MRVSVVSCAFGVQQTTIFELPTPGENLTGARAMAQFRWEKFAHLNSLSGACAMAHVPPLGEYLDSLLTGARAMAHEDVLKFEGIYFLSGARDGPR